MAKIIVLALDSGGPGVFPNRSSVKYEGNEIFNKIQDGACDVDNDDEPEPAWLWLHWKALAHACEAIVNLADAITLVIGGLDEDEMFETAEKHSLDRTLGQAQGQLFVGDVPELWKAGDVPELRMERTVTVIMIWYLNASCWTAEACCRCVWMANHRVPINKGQVQEIQRLYLPPMDPPKEFTYEVVAAVSAACDEEFHKTKK
ncbi:unnamed protein product, partial [Symbiodinium sp. KB8]